MRYFLSLPLVILIFSCASYKTNILLRPTEKEVPEILKSEARTAEKEYIIQKNDQLKMELHLYNGEQIIAPIPTESKPGGQSGDQQKNEADESKYSIDVNGNVKLPMIGEIKLEGLTLRQAEEIVRKEYTKFFKEPYVQFFFTNKRVVVLGALGGQVIPLTNSNTRLPEILALAKGLDNFAKGNNIKLVRNDHVYQFDLTSIEGFKQGNVLIEPGDIIYVEPVRRPFTEGLRDYYLIGSLLIALTTLAVLIKNYK